jgi:hypothetical protein
MKPTLLFILIVLNLPFASAQSKTDTINIIVQKVKAIDQQTNYRTSTLENEAFLDTGFISQPGQGCGQLTAYYKNSQLCKIKEMIGIKLLHQIAYTGYYFGQGKLIYVVEEEHQGPNIFIDSAGTVDRRIDMPGFIALYYFNNDKMIDRVEEGERKTMLLPDEKYFDSQSKEGQLLYSAEKYYKMFMPANDPENSGTRESINVMDTEKIKLRLLQKLSIDGDFDGDGQLEILFQHNFSLRYQKEIIHAADPFGNEWDTVMQWFDRQQPDIYLTMNQKNSDTLHLGSGQGLYCLINLGDNNKDGKDEIALVVDYLDFSRVNTCKIFSLCKNKWKLLKEFSIHEGAFDFENDGNAIPDFSEIKEFLEKHNGKWGYKDYLDDFSDKQEDVGKMKGLKLLMCQ